MADDWGFIKDALLGAIEPRAKAFLSANAPLRQMFEERAGRMRDLAERYATGDLDARAAALSSMDDVRDTMVLQIDALTVRAEAAARSALIAAALAAFDAVIKALPGFVAKLATRL